MAIFKREISSSSILRAYVIIMLTMALVATGVFLLAVIEDASLVDIMFETISASAIVGLSRGLSPRLSDAGKLILIISMIVGRVGSLTLAFALSPGRDDGTYDYPKENVIIA